MTSEDLLSKYLLLAKKLKRLPTMPECLAIGVTRSMVRHHFGNISLLQKLANQKLKFKRKSRPLVDILKEVASEIN